jgi:hypothetical protein
LILAMYAAARTIPLALFAVGPRWCGGTR